MPLLTPPERIGTVVGNRYELREPVGEGGSAVLYAAWDRSLEREVGVKVMRHTGALSSSQERDRFRREAQTLARLRHPHLVDVFDVGETADGVPYVVMELLRGETLAARLERAPSLSASETLAITLPLMGALACAHDVGIIHRDIKPANIFLARRGAGATVPKLLDFGIAKLSDEPAVTSDGMTLGTPAFMAPEQARGEPLAPSADVWAMGVTLFACLAGRLPYDAPTTAGVLMQAARQGTPRLDVKGLDRGLALAVERALAMEPQRRTPTMRALARALAQTARRARVSLPPEPDPAGLPEFAMWCGAADNEHSTDELAAAPSETLASLREPMVSRAADSSSALVSIKRQRSRRFQRLAMPALLVAGLGASVLWLGREGPRPQALGPRANASAAPLAQPAAHKPLRADPPRPTPAAPADAPLAQEPRDAGLTEVAPAPRKPARAKPRRAEPPPAAPATPAPTSPGKPPLKAWDF